MKRLALVLSIGLIMFSSCKKSIPPHLEAIPADAAFVAAFENKKLVDKGELNNLDNYKFLKEIRSQIAEQDSVAQNFINKFLQDPKSCGLDLDQTYVYGKMVDSSKYVAFLFKMGNKATFESRIQELMKHHEGEAPKIEDKGSYKIVNTNDMAVFAWTDKIFCIMAGETKGVNYEEAVNMPVEKSIVNVEEFKPFMEKKYDIGFWMPCESFGKLYTQMLHMNIPIISDMAGIYISGTLNFENGEVKACGTMSPKAKVDEFNAKYPIANKQFDANLLKDFPDQTYLTFKMSINWTEYIKLLNSMMKDMDNGMSFDEVMANNPEINTVLNALGGDMLFSLYGFAQGPMPLPLVGLGFTVKSAEDFDKLLALVPQDMVQQREGHYVISAGPMAAVYFAYKENRVFVTDDADAIKAFIGNGYSKNMGNGSLDEPFKKSPYLVYFNLDFDSYPENVRALLDSEMGSSFKSVVTYLKPYKDLSYYMVDNYNVVFSLKLKDKSQNSLKVLLKSIDDIASSVL